MGSERCDAEPGINYIKDIVAEILRLERKAKEKTSPQYPTDTAVYRLSTCLQRESGYLYPPFRKTVNVQGGKAVSPSEAITCAFETIRTTRFIIGLCDAIKKAKKRFPGERIHVIDRGCGPLGLLGIAAASQFDDIDVTFVDIFPEAIECVKRLAEKLGLTDRINTFVGDASLLKLPQRYHVSITEAMNRGLLYEPQVAITCKTASELIPGGIWLPENVTVSAAFHNPQDELVSKIELFQLTKDTNLATLGCLEEDDLSQGITITRSIDIPPNFEGSVCLVTDVTIFRDHQLYPNESAITLPFCHHLIPSSSYPRTALITFVLGGDFYKMKITQNTDG